MANSGFFTFEPNRTQLAKVASMIDAGELRPIAGAVFPLADARQAYDFAMACWPRAPAGAIELSLWTRGVGAHGLDGAAGAGPEGTKVKSRPRGWSWAALRHRAFAIDALACPHCGGRPRLITTLHDPAVIRKFLAHLGLAHSGQSRGPIRALIGSARARWTPSCLRGEALSVLIRPGPMPVDGGGVPT